MGGYIQRRSRLVCTPLCNPLYNSSLRSLDYSSHEGRVVLTLSVRSLSKIGLVFGIFVLCLPIRVRQELPKLPA